jgi:hydrogenase small subunit
MNISRRDFLKYCGLSATALGLSAVDLGQLEKALASPSGPSVLWLQGAACTGCSVSLLNRISATSPKSAADLLINYINLVYHPNLMALAGDSAVAQAEQIYANGGYVLAIEGGVPTAFGGNTCWPWESNGRAVPFNEAVIRLAGKAAAILCIGTCAAWGGIPAVPPNPMGVKGVKAVTGKNTINIAGCPPHPDWIFWAVAQLLLGKTITLDSYGRPTYLFNRTVHDQCPRREREETEQFGRDGYCLKELGCRGPETRCNCPITRWNNQVSWCVEVNAPCIGCTEPGFPGSESFRHH